MAQKEQVKSTASRCDTGQAVATHFRYSLKIAT